MTLRARINCILTFALRLVTPRNERLENGRVSSLTDCTFSFETWFSNEMFFKMVDYGREKMDQGSVVGLSFVIVIEAR